MARGATALGFRIRTGRAAALLLEGPAGSPQVLLKREIRTHDEAVPESFQPYHAALEAPPARASLLVRKLSAACGRAAEQSIADFLEEARELGAAPRRAGLVVGSETDPASIGNPHMRAHAAEGALFRQVVEEAMARRGIRHDATVEAQALDEGARALGLGVEEIRSRLADLGKAAGRPWRADEKMACLAAWMALAL